jgi:threonyl-tRNA synthetase
LFCTEEQVESEIIGCLELVNIIFNTLGMHDFTVRVGLRNADSDKYVGDPANWEKAENACRTAAATLGVPWIEEKGEAAFYGPKIDFIVNDVIGRKWQLGTVQVDYNLPERFDLSYIGKDGNQHRPVMIHRAPFGSMERFIGVLIEHFAGAFPTWLAPEQVRVLAISEKSNDYADKVHQTLLNKDIRASVDKSDERIQAKIRNAAEMKIPWILVVGPRDAEGNNVSVRMRGIMEDLGAVGLEQFSNALSEEIKSRGKSSALKTCFPDVELPEDA